MSQQQPKIYVTRRLPEAALAPLRTCGEVQVWESDHAIPRETLLQEIIDTVALLGMVTERIDDDLLDHAPQPLAKMNMFLHGQDNHRIEWGDTLRNPKLLNTDETLKHFDVVAANPPFSLEKWGHDEAEHDRYGRFRRGLPPKTKGDYAFILHMIETMKPATGRMGVVVPHGVLFRGAAEGKIRHRLIEENLLATIIGLPEKLFFGTGIPAAILLFKKRRADDTVLFIDASREYQDGKNQNFLRPEDIRKIVRTCHARASVDKYAYLATLDEIKENDFNLNIPRYVDTFEEEEEIDLMQVRREREQLKEEIAALEVEMHGYLKELGYGD